MSGGDNPFGGNRTVIRPNPGGLIDRPPAGRPGPGGAPGQAPSPPFQPLLGAGQGGQGGGFGGAGAGFGGQGAGFGQAGAFGAPGRAGIPQPDANPWGGEGRGQAYFPTDDTAPAPTPQPMPRIPLAVALKAQAAEDVRAANPLIAAAAPLLILIGRLRLLIVEMQPMPLMQHVTRSIREFEERLLAVGVPRDEVTVAKYALCATADDVVQNLPGADKDMWTQYSMASQFFNTRKSGVGFFEELEKLRANAGPNFNLLELMHACLSLGFEGMYRASDGGMAQLQRIRRDLHQTLRRLKPQPDEDLSPRWQGLSLPMQVHRTRVPVWAVGTLAGLALLGIYFLFRLLLSDQAEATAGVLASLHPDSPVAIERAAFTPMKREVVPATTQLERMRAAIADEIAAGRADVERLGDRIVVRVSNLALFDSGSAEVRADFQPVAERIARMLEAEKGEVRVVGHTDNVRPKRTGRFKSNYDLSVARAEGVHALLAPLLSDATRFQVSGKGEDEPIGDNKTAEGRSMNRRVEISIPAEETLQ